MDLKGNPWIYQYRARTIPIPVLTRERNHLNRDSKLKMKFFFPVLVAPIGTPLMNPGKSSSLPRVMTREVSLSPDKRAPSSFRIRADPITPRSAATRLYLTWKPPSLLTLNVASRGSSRAPHCRPPSTGAHRPPPAQRVGNLGMFPYRLVEKFFPNRQGPPAQSHYTLGNLFPVKLRNHKHTIKF